MESIGDVNLAFLNRAIRLAMNGRGQVEPNPMVGCVIVKDGHIIGEGYHQQFGGPHAEPSALTACKVPPTGATVYVTLEPCCHTNKKTPPCVPKLIEAKVARVVVGCPDPNPAVSGRGMEQLRAAGIEVVCLSKSAKISDSSVASAPRTISPPQQESLADPRRALGDSRAHQLIAPYIARTLYRRPYVTLKWAQTADSRVAGPRGKRIRITNSSSDRLVHTLRARSDAILIGIGTARNDDPQLTVRGFKPARPLIRVVLDSDLRLSVDSQLVRTIDKGRVIVFCSKEAAEYSGTRATLTASGVEIHAVSSDRPGRLKLENVLTELARLDVTHLLVEPGPTLASSFIESSLVDRIWVFQSPQKLDNPTGPVAASVLYPKIAERDVDGDRLTEYLNLRSDVFFSAEPSADFVLIPSPDDSSTTRSTPVR